MAVYWSPDEPPRHSPDVVGVAILAAVAFWLVVLGALVVWRML